jgi:hypothetical protein
LDILFGCLLNDSPFFLLGSNEISVRQDKNILSSGPSGLLGEAALGKAQSVRHNDPKTHTWMVSSLKVLENKKICVAYSTARSRSIGSSFTQSQARKPRCSQNTKDMEGLYCPQEILQH